MDNFEGDRKHVRVKTMGSARVGRKGWNKRVKRKREWMKHFQIETEVSKGMCQALCAKKRTCVTVTQVLTFLWSGKRDLNPRPSAWEADTLPLSYSRSCC